MILSGETYDHLAKYRELVIKVKAPSRSRSVVISLVGFDQLKDVFDQPVCTGR